MPKGLKDPILKLERAEEHLEILHMKIMEFVRAKPFSISEHEDIKNGRYVLKFQIPIIDPYLGILAGDAISCLRSALDHLAWQLALSKTDRPFDRTEFPVVGENTPENIRRFDRVTQSIPRLAIDEIKTLQPYNRGPSYKDDLLWKIDKMCNIDKHRVIPTHGTAVEMKIPKGIDVVPSRFNDAYIVSMPISVKAQMKFAPSPTYDILFGSEVDGLVIGYRELSKMYEHVRETIFPRFTRFFSE